MASFDADPKLLRIAWAVSLALQFCLHALRHSTTALYKHHGSPENTLSGEFVDGNYLAPVDFISLVICTQQGGGENRGRITKLITPC